MYTRDSEYFTARPDTPEERAVYSYIRRLANEIQPETATEWFYRLLHQGETLSELDPNQTIANDLKEMLKGQRHNGQVRQGLRQMLDSEEVNDSLLFFVNRCFYTVGNRWRLDSTRHKALKNLINQVHARPRREPHNRDQRRLYKAVEQYSQQTQFYVPLQRQMLLLSSQADDPDPGVDVSFRDCFKKYFFLYEAAAATPDIPMAERKGLQLQQGQEAQRLRLKLQNFWLASNFPDQAQPVNPTSIPDPDLKDLIWRCHPSRTNSYQDQAKTFHDQHRKIRTNQALCDQLFQYVMEPIIEHDPSYQNNRFSHMVKDTLQHCIRGEEKAPVNAITTTQMCIRLLKLLVCNTLKEPRFTYFKHLIEKVGHQVVTTVLLKIILFRRTVRPWFENRFGILFHIWESYSVKDIPWLVQAFEYMNVALALNAPWINYLPKAGS